MNDDGLVIGPREWLFEKVYLDDFFNVGPLAPEKALLERAEAIDALRRACERKGICFLLVISPSKAAFYPEEAPAWYQRKGPRVERNYDRFVRLLRERSVPVIDGHAILVRQRKELGCPALFSQGGIHWNSWAAGLVMQDILSRTERYFRRPMASLRMGEPRTDFNPADPDMDLALLLNLPRPPIHYEVVKVDHRIEVPSGAFLPRTYWVGDSFSQLPLAMVSQGNAQTFGTLDFGYYYGKFLRGNERGELVEIPGKAESMAALPGTELLVLEVNEASILAVDYALRFSKEAIEQLR